ncbi:MAG: hypothetical protein IPN72_15080 [Saprospiraceae bacterium]|nr:hypothetical protein [Saprospiraceae bacterium]
MEYNNTFFVNESDGTVNVNAPTTNQWTNLNFTNKGLFKKVSNTITQFNNNFGTGNFKNDIGGNIKGIGTVSHMNTYAYLSGSAISPGASPGLLSVISSTSPLNYGLSTYNCEINGTTAVTQHDQLSSSGQVNLSQMSLNVIWGFTPTVGQSFTIMNHSSIIGEFANVTIPNIANYVYKIDYNPTNVILHVYLRFYEDFDQDTYGNANIFQDGPTAPVNFVLDNSDCDDTNSAINQQQRRFAI